MEEDAFFTTKVVPRWLPAKATVYARARAFSHVTVATDRVDPRANTIVGEETIVKWKWAVKSQFLMKPIVKWWDINHNRMIVLAWQSHSLNNADVTYNFQEDCGSYLSIKCG